MDFKPLAGSLGLAGDLLNTYTRAPAPSNRSMRARPLALGSPEGAGYAGDGSSDNKIRNPTMSLMRSTLGLFGFVLLVSVVAATGGYFKPGDWYAALAKPAWTPPDWLFPVAWALLYLSIAVSGWLVWRKVGFRQAVLPYSLYALQLVLNAAWSWLFFGLHRMDLAFIDIVLLWLTILATIVAFYRLHRAAGLLLVPYFVWVGFAAALNLAVWRLNV